MPTLSGWLFYAQNLVIVSGYLYAALMIASGRGGTKEWSLWVRIAGLLFFLTCGGTHIEMALHSLFQVPMVAPEHGHISLHVLLIHGLQAPAIWAFLLLQRAKSPKGVEPLPLEGGVVAVGDEVDGKT